MCQRKREIIEGARRYSWKDNKKRVRDFLQTDRHREGDRETENIHRKIDSIERERRRERERMREKEREREKERDRRPADRERETDRQKNLHK